MEWGSVSAVERAVWDLRVDVYFQAKAWFDSRIADEWVKRTFSQFVKDVRRAYREQA